MLFLFHILNPCRQQLETMYKLNYNKNNTAMFYRSVANLI